MSGLLFELLVPGSPGSASRDRLADGIAIGCALAYGGLMVSIGDATRPGAPVPLPVDVAIGVVAAFGLLARRRRPVAVAAAVIPLTAVSVLATGAAVVALFTVAVHRRARIAFLLGAAYVAVVAVYFVLHDRPSFPLWVDLVARAGPASAAIGWGLFVGSLRERAARVEADQRLRVEQARLTERARIAREMHDVLAHRLSLVSLHAGALEVRTDARPEEIALAAGAIRGSVHDALQELRTVIGVLREGAAGRPEPPQPGFADLPELVDGARATGMTVGYTCRVPERGPSVVLGRTVYRVVQEGLTNARKHAPGEPVEVLLDCAADAELRVRITNPAGPVSPPGGAGMGLIGVGERVALVGGRVEHGPSAGGFRLEAWLPWT
ncbi:two-component sensor histidine kinase [Asanoa ishikariensis]|uniref:histidine kinase n=1 Tax=Asanoa ishikariensis TaxID=137265 RepID=A0A1H3SZP3_9ACTN|nr:histidine kinase [Asanoa ishikariensis]GIF63258.1 two-component sensor histidine kinase [Asanoa ishikariensis]SDZ42975.1 Signal transduction histidine kinase [Asanoa ishikariensis]